MITSPISSKLNTKFLKILTTLISFIIVSIIVFQIYIYIINNDSENDGIEKIVEIKKPEEETKNFIQNFRVIRVALYPPGSSSDKVFNLIFSYTWYTNNTEYKYEVTTLTLNQLKGRGGNSLNINNYDVLVVGAAFNSFFIDANSELLVKNIRKFVSDGGGYIGVCAGAGFASQGFKDATAIYEKYFNKNILKIIDVYINCDFNEESAYIWKLGEYVNDPKQGMIPLNCKVNRDVDNPIFDTYNKSTINITYGGGPGLYIANANNLLLGEVTPMLYINEDLMKTAPIHKWSKTLTGWKKEEKINIDIFGMYGGVYSTYGKGRVIILSAHPEIPLTINGHVKEYPGFSCGYGIGIRIPRMVYMYEGEVQNYSQNWWIHRRAAAWLAGVPEEDLPLCNELLCFLNKPKSDWEGKQFSLYINNYDKTTKITRKIVRLTDKTVIVGEIDIQACVENCEYLEFYIDDHLKYTDYKSPFIFNFKNDLEGIHKIEIRGYDKYGNYASDEGEYLFLKD